MTLRPDHLRVLVAAGWLLTAPAGALAQTASPPAGVESTKSQSSGPASSRMPDPAAGGAATAAPQVPAPISGTRPAITVAPRPAPRPFGRVSFFSSTAQYTPDGFAAETTSEFITAVSYQTPEQLGPGVDYAIDLRHSAQTREGSEARTSIYNAYVGARFAGGLVKVRGGQMWLSEFGGLGNVAGALVEIRQQSTSAAGRFRAGAFFGVEPETHTVGFVAGVRKLGGYAALDGGQGRRHVAGLVRLTHGGLLERQVLTFSNFIPAGGRLFVYQVGEYDLSGPAGEGDGRLSYFLLNGRVTPVDRLELQASFHRGRSIDARSITEDILNGRPVTTTAAEGYFYESIGGRVTVEVLPRQRVYGGYTRDRNNRDSEPTGRRIVGFSSSDLAGTGVDVTVSDSRIDRPTGAFHSYYTSVGRQLGRSLYLSVDYSSSLSVVRYTRLDGVTVELRPETRRLGSQAVITVGRHVSLLVTAEQTRDDQSRELRVMAGMTYRMR